jgi:uncharacterized protein YukE
MGLPGGTIRMPQAIVDPAELRRFAYQLKQFNADLQQNLAALHGRLLGLGDTWRDQEHQKFLAEFEDALRWGQKFSVACEAHIPFLLRKAERAEEYLSQR